MEGSDCLNWLSMLTQDSSCSREPSATTPPTHKIMPLPQQVPPSQLPVKKSRSSTNLQPTVSTSYHSSPISPIPPTLYPPDNLGDSFGGSHLTPSPLCSSDTDVMFTPIQTPPSFFDRTHPPENWNFIDNQGSDFSPVPAQTGHVWPNVRTATAPQVPQVPPQQVANKSVFDPETFNYPGFNYPLVSSHLQYCTSVTGQRVYHSNPASSLNLASTPSPCQTPLPISKNDVTSPQQLPAHSKQYSLFPFSSNHGRAESPANQKKDKSSQSALSPFPVPSLKSKYPAVARSSSCVTPRRSVSAYKMSSNNSSKEILKILAEVFRVTAEKHLKATQQQKDLTGGDPGTSGMEWEKLSESLVPICVICMEESPVCVFHVTGIMYPDTKILDSKIFNPGTKITRTTNYFVQWSDRTKGGLWGLNFISEKDALRFLNCCAPTASPGKTLGAPNQALIGKPNFQVSASPPRKPQHTTSPKHLKNMPLLPDMVPLPGTGSQQRPVSCAQMEETVQMVGEMLYIKSNNDSSQPVQSITGVRHTSRQSPMPHLSMQNWNPSVLNSQTPIYPTPNATAPQRNRSLTPVGGALHGHSLSFSGSAGSGGSRHPSPSSQQYFFQPNQSPRSESPMSVSSNGSCQRHTCGKASPVSHQRLYSPLLPPSYLQYSQNSGQCQPPQGGYYPSWNSSRSSNHSHKSSCSDSEKQDNSYGSINVVPNMQQSHQTGAIYPYATPPPPPHPVIPNPQLQSSQYDSPDVLPSPSGFHETETLANYLQQQHSESLKKGALPQNDNVHKRKGSNGNMAPSILPPHLGPLQTNTATGSPFLPRGYRFDGSAQPQNSFAGPSDDSTVYSELLTIMKNKQNWSSPCSTNPNNTLERTQRHPILPPRIPAPFLYPEATFVQNYDPDLLSLNDGEPGVFENPTGDQENLQGFRGIPVLSDTKAENESSPQDPDSPNFNDDSPPEHKCGFYPSPNLLQLNSKSRYVNINVKALPPHSTSSVLSRSDISSEGFVSPGSEMTNTSDQGFCLEDLQNTKRDSTLSQTDSGFEGHHGGTRLSTAGSDHHFSNSKSSANSSQSSIAKIQGNPLQASPAKTNTSDSSTTSSNKGSSVPGEGNSGGNIPHTLTQGDLSSVLGEATTSLPRRPGSSCAASHSSDRSNKSGPNTCHPGTSGLPTSSGVLNMSSHHNSGASLDNLTDDSSSSKGIVEDTVRSFVDCNESLSEDNRSESSEISKHVGPGVSGLLDVDLTGAGGHGSNTLLGVRSHPKEGGIDPGEEEEDDNCVDPTDPTFKRYGVTRKAGWLEIKHVLYLNAKKKKLETAPKRKWKRYWTCLKGNSMLFYSIQTELPSIDENSIPELVLGIENSIAQPIPEHPKRENVFSLSTFHGNVYLCEALSSAELDNWITAIHSSCANAVVLKGSSHLSKTQKGGSQSGQPGGDGSSTVAIVMEEIRKREERIDTDQKMKKMAELQLSITPDHKSRQIMSIQISEWESNVEKLNCDLYRLRCYCASLQGTELPNPRTLLSAVSKETKLQLSRLNVFSSSSVHALLSGKYVLLSEKSADGTSSSIFSGASPEAATSNSLERGRRKMYHHCTSPDQGHELHANHQPSNCQSKPNDVLGSSFNRNDNIRRSQQQQPSSRCSQDQTQNHSVNITPEGYQRAKNYNSSSGGNSGYLIPPDSAGVWEHLSKGKLARVFLPHNQKTVEAVVPQMSVNELLLRCCKKRKLDHEDHFIRIRAPDRSWVIPSPKCTLESLNCQDIEVCIKEYHAVTLSRNRTERFGIEYETVEERLVGKEILSAYPRLFVRDVLPSSIAQIGGLESGDEILEINGHSVRRQDPHTVDDLLKVDVLQLVIRSLRPSTAPCPQCVEHLEPDGPNVSHFKRSSFYGEDSSASLEKRKSDFSDNSNNSSSGIASGSSAEGSGSGGVTGQSQSGQQPAQQTMKDGTRLGCLIQELISTEENYIKDLKFLTDVYLEPLLQCSFLIDIEVEAVTSNVHEIVSFQEKFCSELKNSVENEPDFVEFQEIAQFKTILIKLCNAFKCYTDQFKLYSAFCANHSKAQRVFAEVKDVPEFRDMLDQKNPEQEHSRSLESFLIKPIQRVLKYPLILREIKCIVGGTTPDQSECVNTSMAPEFEGLSSALRAMENVAEHINDMKRIHEEYGPIFEQLIADQDTKYIHELPMDELLMYGSAAWINCPEDLVPRKLKSAALEIDVMIFIFKKAVIVLPGCGISQNKEKQKKRRLTLPGPANSKSDIDTAKIRSLIPVSTISVCKETKEDPPKKFYWELISSRTEFHVCKNQHFQMLSRSGETRRQFVKAIIRCFHDLIKAEHELARNNYLVSSRLANERRVTDRNVKRSNSQHGNRNPYQRSNSASTKEILELQTQSETEGNDPATRPLRCHDNHNRLISPSPGSPTHQHNHHIFGTSRAIPTYYPPLTEGHAPVKLPSQLGVHNLVAEKTTSDHDVTRKTQADSGVFVDENDQHYINTIYPRTSSEITTPSDSSSIYSDPAPIIPPRPFSTVPQGGTFAQQGASSTAAALLSPTDFASRVFGPTTATDFNSLNSKLNFTSGSFRQSGQDTSSHVHKVSDA